MLVATQYAGFVAGGLYRPNGVNFDGSTHLTRGADLTGAANTKVGLLSFWLNPASDGVGTTLVSDFPDATSLGLVVSRLSTNLLQIRAENSGVILRLKSTSTVLTAAGWRHVMASWNLATGAGKLYIDDVDDTDLQTASDVIIDYTRTNHSIGGSPSGAQKLNGDFADVYFDHGTYLDLTIEANRRKFIDPNGKAVDLGKDGSFVTGSSPIMFFAGPTASWHTNKGSGGGFSVTSGALTDAATSPSD